jgi:hypothetical protein
MKGISKFMFLASRISFSKVGVDFAMSCLTQDTWALRRALSCALNVLQSALPISLDGKALGWGFKRPVPFSDENSSNLEDLYF